MVLVQVYWILDVILWLGGEQEVWAGGSRLYGQGGARSLWGELGAEYSPLSVSPLPRCTGILWFPVMRRHVVWGRTWVLHTGPSHASGPDPAFVRV